MATPTSTAYAGGPARRDGGPISTLTTPYTFAATCTEIFALTEITYSDATETVIISDISDTRFGGCQPTGFDEVAITSRFTFSPAVCPNGWMAYSLFTAGGGVSTGWCCSSGFTLYSATDWPIAWATQPCIKVIEDATTIAETVVSSCTQAHAPWHISWQPSDTTTMWPVPPAWTSGGRCIDTWTPGGATVYQTITEKGLSTSTEAGGVARPTSTTAAVAAAGGSGDENGNDNGVSVASTNAGLFWFLVIGLPVLAVFALALCCMFVYYRRVTKRARRRRRRRMRRVKVVEVET